MLLVASIIMTLFCCLPAGIAGIVFTFMCMNNLKVEDYEAATKNSKIAFYCLIGGLVAYGLIVLPLTVLIMLA